MDAPELPSRFGSSLSRVLFVDVDVPNAVRPTATERQLAKQIIDIIVNGTDEQRHAMCWSLQEQACPVMCAESLMEVGRAMQSRAPWMIDQIRKLSSQASMLRRAADMAQTFQPTNLERLVLALKEEGARL